MSIFEKKIYYFMSVVKEGSFSSAAKKNYVSQANLSKQIALLEKEIGTELFDRSGYRPVLTDAGKYFYDKLVIIDKKEKELFEGLSKYLPGIIKVGFTGIFENLELVEAVRAFQKNYPNHEIELIKFDFEGCEAALTSEKIDICFGLESIFKKNKWLHYDLLHGYNICLVCNKNHHLAKYKEVTSEQIKNEEMIILSKRFNAVYYNDFMNSCKKDGYKPTVKKEVDSLDELLLSVCLGEGIALFGENILKDDCLIAIPIINTSHSPNYVVAYKENHINPNTELFLNFIKEHFQTL